MAHPITIFSGGSAANSLVDVFHTISRSKSAPITYIIPISDNGGSTSELIRVFGGPGIGDVRSRLVRLIPPLPEGSFGYLEREGIRHLFNHRLSSSDATAARDEWNMIVDGTSPIWKYISSAKKELIRSILNTINLEILKRSRPPRSTFDFTSASVGNLFLTGARLFTGSFESAIYLLSSICGVKEEEVKVIPSINSNFSHHIAAGLEDGTVIVGQNSISHPSSTPHALVVPSRAATRLRNGSAPHGPSGGGGAHASDDLDSSTWGTDRGGDDDDDDDDDHGDHDDEADQDEEDAHIPGTLLTLRMKNITFSKDAHLHEELPARISRLWYINPYGQEILPPANPRAVSAISSAQAIIYSIGSLYTSLVPNLVLRGIGAALRKKSTPGGVPRSKILILNGSLDREVGPQPPAPGSHGSVFSAVDFVKAVVKAGEQSRGIDWQDECETSIIPARPKISSERDTDRALVAASALLSPDRTYPPPLLASAAPTRNASPASSPLPSPMRQISDPIAAAAAAATIKTNKSAQAGPNPIYADYITHIIHLPNGPGIPHVDRDLLQSRYGIQCVRVYGRSTPGEAGMRYDPQALRGAIEAILGRNAGRAHWNTGGGPSSSLARERDRDRGNGTRSGTKAGLDEVPAAEDGMSSVAVPSARRYTTDGVEWS